MVGEGEFRISGNSSLNAFLDILGSILVPVVVSSYVTNVPSPLLITKKGLDSQMVM